MFFYYYYNYYYFFIVIIVIIIIVFSIFNGLHFILFHFYSIFNITMTFVVLVCVTSMRTSLFSFSSCYWSTFCICISIIFLLSSLLSHHYICIIIVITIFIWLLSTVLVIAAEFSKWIWVAWSTSTHWLLWVSCRVIINKYLVATVELLYFYYIYHMTSFNL